MEYHEEGEINFSMLQSLKEWPDGLADALFWEYYNKMINGGVVDGDTGFN